MRTAIAGLGGYVSDSDQTNQGDQVSASITYRVPVARWQDALDAIQKIATKVDSAKSNAVEVTGQVLDLGARIDNLRTTEPALQAIMARATKIADVLDVESKLSDVQGQIEQLSTEQAHLKDQASLATLTVLFGLPPTQAVVADVARLGSGRTARSGQRGAARHRPGARLGRDLAADRGRATRDRPPDPARPGDLRQPAPAPVPPDRPPRGGATDRRLRFGVRSRPRSPGVATNATLPDHVQSIVAEIETDIGESSPVLGEGTPDLGGSDRIEHAVRDILTEIGEDPDREGLRRTPDRIHRMYHELTAGYHVDPDRLINGAVFAVDYSEMVVVKGIEFYSLCEHHLLPFFGTAAVGYLPRDRVIGLSKIPRIVEMYARRLQVQERLTQEVADFLMERIDPLGVGVVIEAQHLCTAMRGVRKGGATMVTSAVLGTFRKSQRTREEFMAHLERGDNRR